MNNVGLYNWIKTSNIEDYEVKLVHVNTKVNPCMCSYNIQLLLYIILYGSLIVNN